MGTRSGRKVVASDLAPRVRPVQERSKHTVDLILDSAGVLLDEVGIDALNTNLLAESADIAVRSVYRYYPNKLAVIVGLAERQSEQWREISEELMVPLADPDQSVLDAWDRVLDSYVAFLEGKRGRSAIRRAMLALPQLNDVNNRDNEHLCEPIASALRARGTSEPDARLRILSRLLLDTTDAVFDEALSRKARVPTQLLEELKRMHRSYLALCFD
ncbi:MAG: TetR/AcrR family transcriptional regulator [Myxococcota bacterium]